MRWLIAAAVLAFASPALAGAPVYPPASADTAPPFAVKIVPATPLPVAVPQPLICRSAIETGSLIQRHKQCLTKAQWRYVDDQHETAARKLMEDSMSKPNCDAHC